MNYDEKMELVKKDAKLQFKALIFLNHKLCKTCRNTTLVRASKGKPFRRESLCVKCQKLYDLEVRE